MRTNLGYLFYQKMYQFDAAKRKLIINGDAVSQLTEKQTFDAVQLAGTQRFILKTTYPGLLIGTGYAHGIDDEKDFKAGFYFDYTTGMPVIPGSSIKGTIKSAFINAIQYDKSYILSKLPSEHKDIQIDDLIKDMFENGNDIYFDAFPTGQIAMTNDYITPHGEDVTSEPEPIKMLRVEPDVTYLFQFKLHDNTIPAQAKLELIKEVILDIGLGAKTSTGYGMFVEV